MGKQYTKKRKGVMMMMGEVHTYNKAMLIVLD
jgi:hypothetical protein